jgi:tetratricopeptide (TPR) repeat protein
LSTTTEPPPTGETAAPAVAAPSRLRTAITCVLLGAWCVILTGAICTWINPSWMQQISRPGRMSEASAHSAAGVQRLRAGDYESAIASFEMALSIYEDIQTRVHLGIAYARAGQFERGQQILRQVLDANPGRFLRGVILFNIGELQFRIPEQRNEAFKSFTEALECGAEPDKVHLRLGQILVTQGKAREALAELEKALHAQLDPAQGYRNMLQRTMEGYSVAPTEEIEFQAAAGITEQELARYDVKLIKAFQQADNPELSHIYYLLGNLHVAVGELPAARQAFSDAVRVWPKNQDAAAKLERVKQMEQRAATTQPATQP